MLQLFHEAAPAVDIDRRLAPSPELTLAVSATWCHGSGRLDWIAANGLACAYTPNPDRLDLISPQLIPYTKKGMRVRHHGYFPGEEIGHAVSSQCVCHKAIRLEKIIHLVAERLMEVHFYESETDRHWAPRNMDIFGPIVDELVTTDCRWWTIELEDTQEVLLTQKLLVNHFDNTQKPLFCRPETEAVCALPV